MKRKAARIRETSIRRQIDFGNVQDPWLMLAAMIFLQARDDAAWLRGKQTGAAACHQFINKYEILNFLRSDWGQMLAASLGVSQKDLDEFEKAIMEGNV